MCLEDMRDFNQIIKFLVKNSGGDYNEALKIKMNVDKYLRCVFLKIDSVIC